MKSYTEICNIIDKGIYNSGPYNWLNTTSPNVASYNNILNALNLQEKPHFNYYTVFLNSSYGYHAVLKPTAKSNIRYTTLTFPLLYGHIIAKHIPDHYSLEGFYDIFKTIIYNYKNAVNDNENIRFFITNTYGALKHKDIFVHMNVDVHNLIRIKCEEIINSIPSEHIAYVNTDTIVFDADNDYVMNIMKDFKYDIPYHLQTGISLVNLSTLQKKYMDSCESANDPQIKDILTNRNLIIYHEKTYKNFIKQIYKDNNLLVDKWLRYAKTINESD